MTRFDPLSIAMTDQTDLFYKPEPPRQDAIAARDDAMAKVKANAGDNWNKYAQGLIASVARRLMLFTSDDIMDAMTVPPHDPRALGPALVQAAKDGLIIGTGNFVQSRRRHASPIRVWKLK